MLDDRQYMRSDYRPGWSMATILLVSNIACFLLQNVLGMVLGRGMFDRLFALSLDGLMHGWVWQLITFQFLHGSIWHLLGNLLGLYFFGRAMEESLGSKGLLKLYLLSGTLGGLLQIGMGFVAPAQFGSAVLGASAGVFGLVAAFAVSRPNQPITMLLFFILPLTFPAKVILAAEAVITVWGLIAPPDGIAHAAHLGGMLTGIAYMLWFSDPTTRLRWQWPRFFRRSSTNVITPPRRTWRASARVRTEEVPSAEFITSQVDPILDKISAQGIHSLTDEERQILEAARNRMAKH